MNDSGALEVLRKHVQEQGWLRKDRFDSAQLLCDFSFEGDLQRREQALAEILDLLLGPYIFTREGKVLGKIKNPLIYIPSAPGRGKSRLLSAFLATCDPNNPDHKVATTILEQLLSRSDQPGLEMHKDFVAALRGAVPISVTFNHGSLFEPALPVDQTARSALAARAFYSFFIDPEEKGWVSFAVGVQSNGDIETVLKFIKADIDEEKERRRKDAPHERPLSGHILLAVDEIVKTNNVNELLASLFPAMDRLPYAHTVVSTLSEDLVKKTASESGRAIRKISLEPLSYDESISLVQHAVSRLQIAKKVRAALYTNENEFNPTLSQFIKDAAGWPRYLESIVAVVSDTHQESDANSLPTLYTSMSNRVFLDINLTCRQALLFSLGKPRAQLMENELDNCVRSGYLGSHDYSTVAPLLIRTLGRKPSERKDAVAWAIISHLYEFLGHQLPSGNEGGFNFEKRLRPVWKLVSLVSAAPWKDSVFEADLRSLSVPVQLKHLLRLPNSSSNVFDTLLRVPANYKEINLDTKDRREKGILNKVFEEELKPGHLVFGSDKMPGFDFLSVHEVADGDSKGKKFVVAVEVKYTDSTTALSSKEVAGKIVTLCKTHKSLASYIKDERFACVFLAWRESNVEDHQVRDIIEAEKNQNTKDLAIKVWEATAILCKSGIVKLIGPTYCRHAWGERDDTVDE